MKTVNVILISIALLTLLMVNAEASNKPIGGLIIGGSTGAIVGNAVGKNTESTLIGATVGGVLGYVIGNELDRQHRPVINHPQLATHSQKYHKRYQSSFRDNNRHHKYKKNRYRHYPSYNPYSGECKKIVTVHNKHNKTKRVITSSCGNKHRKYDKNKNHYRYNDRHYR